MITVDTTSYVQRLCSLSTTHTMVSACLIYFLFFFFHMFCASTINVSLLRSLFSLCMLLIYDASYFSFFVFLLAGLMTRKFEHVVPLHYWPPLTVVGCGHLPLSHPHYASTGNLEPSLQSVFILLHDILIYKRYR